MLKENIDLVLVAIIGGILIAWLETIALFKNVDGVGLSLAIGGIVCIITAVISKLYYRKKK